MSPPQIPNPSCPPSFPNLRRPFLSPVGEGARACFPSTLLGMGAILAGTPVAVWSSPPVSSFDVSAGLPPSYAHSPSLASRELTMIEKALIFALVLAMAPSGGLFIRTNIAL